MPSPAPAGPPPTGHDYDSALHSLAAVMRVLGQAADPRALAHRFGRPGGIDTLELVRAARQLDLKARAITTGWDRLDRTPLPAIARLATGGFVVLAAIRRDGGPRKSWCSTRPRGGRDPGRAAISRRCGAASWCCWPPAPGWPVRPGASTCPGSSRRSSSTAGCWARCCWGRSSCMQQLAVNTVGGVVTSAQALMVVVPADADIEVEASLRNRDAGFVAPGQPVDVKLEAFQFTKYGSVPGRVQSVSRDAVPDERRGLVYPVRIVLDRGTIDVDGRAQPLSPGMALTAEIKTGDRRIIDYLLSPMMRYRDEAMRER